MEAPRSATVIIIENGPGDQSSNPKCGYEVLHSANILEKDMHPTILPPVMGK